MVAWYRNDGDGVFGARRIITDFADLFHSALVADIDGDGALDVLSTGRVEVAWFRNGGAVD